MTQCVNSANAAANRTRSSTGAAGIPGVKLLGIVAILGLILIATVNALIYEDKPCAIIHCGGEDRGFFAYQAQEIGGTEHYAVCQCPNSPLHTYHVARYRTY